MSVLIELNCVQIWRRASRKLNLGMNKSLKNRFKLNFKNQFFIKLLLTIVLIYSNSKKLDGLCGGPFERIVSNEILNNISSNLISSKIIENHNLSKVRANLIASAFYLTIVSTSTFTSGKITTGANKVILKSLGPVSESGGSYVVGKSQKI